MIVDKDCASPNPMVVFAGSTSYEIAYRIAEHLDIELGKADTVPHPDGESMVKIKSDVRNRDVFVVQSIAPKFVPEGDNPYSGINDSLVELFLWIDALARSSAFRITAVIPYFGYARQDRKAAGRTPISARVVATILEEIGCHRVLTLDLHADQIQGFFGYKTKLDHLNSGPIFARYYTEMDIPNAVILSPDFGNVKKADRYRAGMPGNYDMAIIDKRRCPMTGEISVERLIGDVEGKTVIMLDDIISTAGTLRSAIEIAEKNGAKDFYVGASHLLGVGKAPERLDHPKIKEIAVTDSIPSLNNLGDLPVKRISCAPLLGEAIVRIHEGLSISEMLGEFS